MSASHAIDVHQRPRRRRPRRQGQKETGSFHPARDTPRRRKLTVSLPVPMLDWPSRLYSDAHPMADDDQFDGVPNAGNGLHGYSHVRSEMSVLTRPLTSATTHAGVAP